MHMKLTPSISIVTPSFNQAMFIEEAIESVRLQNYSKVEHLIIDGHSTDRTIKLLADLKSSDEGRRVKWISERDGGQSEALNKGFKQANGEIVGWLNADDRYRPGCFEQIIQAFIDYPEIDIFYGDYVLIDEYGNTLQPRREIEFNSFVLRHHRVLYIATTATFFRRKIFDDGNRINEKLHYAMDFEFFLRLASNGYRFMHFPKILADYRLQPNSKTCSSPNLQRDEHYRVLLNITRRPENIRLEFFSRGKTLILRLIAGVERYSEKMIKGYYWNISTHNRFVQNIKIWWQSCRY